MNGLCPVGHEYRAFRTHNELQEMRKACILMRPAQHQDSTEIKIFKSTGPFHWVGGSEETAEVECYHKC